jgi:hypothetical protein
MDNWRPEKKTANELKIDEILLRLHKESAKSKPCLCPVRITEIRKSNKKVPMIDISTEKRNFFANGLLVHNSSVRFEHLREEAAKDFFRRVSEKINQLLTDYEEKLRGVIVGGPGMTKQEFLKQGTLDYRLKDKILGTVDNSYTDESGIRELMQKSEEILKDTAITRERQIVNRFLEQAVVDGLATYGQKETEEALAMGKASDVLVSEAINWEVVKLYCENCNFTQEKIVKEPEKFDERKMLQMRRKNRIVGRSGLPGLDGGKSPQHQRSSARHQPGNTRRTNLLSGIRRNRGNTAIQVTRRTTDARMAIFDEKSRNRRRYQTAVLGFCCGRNRNG